MDRRAFVAGSLGAALAPTPGSAGSAAGTNLVEPSPSSLEAEVGAKPRPLPLEWRSYRLRFGPMEGRFAEFAKNAFVPALERAGVKPVGAFTVMFGPDSPTVHLLLAHPDADSVVALGARLEADAEYRRAGAAFHGLPPTDPPFVRLESSLMVAFASMPRIEAPAGPFAVPSRIFELRTYESHNRAAGAKKIEMFEAGGEIGIFRRLGMAPVFFARNLVGSRLPGLTYMLAYPDLSTREKCWAAFRDDPEWAKLRSTPGFSNAEILTNITVQLLRPTDYSRI